MSLNAQATNRYFNGLKCPYTGKPITVRVVAHGRRPPMYFSPDAYDPSLMNMSSADLLLKASMRNGVIGVVQGDKLSCPYTGEKLTLVRLGEGFMLTGGFSPASLHADAAEFGRMLLTRNGKFTGDERLFAKGNIIFADREPVEKDPTPDAGQLSGDAMEAVGGITHSLSTSQTITVPGGVPKKKEREVTHA